MEIVEQAKELIREHAVSRADDETTVHLVAVALLQGESRGLRRGADLAIAAMRDTLLEKLEAWLTGGNAA